MKNNIKYLLIFALITGVASFPSCNDKDTLSALTPAYYPNKVEMIIPSEYNQYVYIDESDNMVLPLIIGQNLTIGHNIYPDTCTFKDIVWESSNPEIASIDNSGNLSALSAGSTTVLLAPDPYYPTSGIPMSIKVIVYDKVKGAEQITVSSTAEVIYSSETAQMHANILPDDATYHTVKWSTSDASVAVVDDKGLVTGLDNPNYSSVVTITATAMDGSGVSGSYDITVLKKVEPKSVTINPYYSVENGYLGAWNERYVSLEFTTEPEQCTRSMITWSSSDESIATVCDGVVEWNKDGKFGNVSITATCPNGQSSSINMLLEEGLMRELFHNPNWYSWRNAAQSGNGTSSSHVWHDGYVAVTTYKQNDTNQRGDFRFWGCPTGTSQYTPAYIHAGYYPLVAIRWQDVMDLYEEVTFRAINLDTSGSCAGSSYSGNVGGGNNKWAYEYLLSDGSRVMVYDLSTQSFGQGMLPTTALATFNTFQFKYADMRTLTEQITYNVYWVQTFKTRTDIEKFISDIDGLSFETIK
ncbi:MAG: DUF4979 domain-containing protein [Bacteroidaceae bacterium]|nr:DUF4979 domain-containing protein [Bacteroidaceae bacterium]